MGYKHRDMRRRHAISPGFSDHYRDLGISSIKGHDSACTLILSVVVSVTSHDRRSTVPWANCLKTRRIITMLSIVIVPWPVSQYYFWTSLRTSRWSLQVCTTALHYAVALRVGPFLGEACRYIRSTKRVLGM